MDELRHDPTVPCADQARATAYNVRHCAPVFLLSSAVRVQPVRATWPRCSLRPGNVSQDRLRCADGWKHCSWSIGGRCAISESRRCGCIFVAMPTFDAHRTIYESIGEARRSITLRHPPTKRHAIATSGTSAHLLTRPVRSPARPCSPFPRQLQLSGPPIVERRSRP